MLYSIVLHVGKTTTQPRLFVHAAIGVLLSLSAFGCAIESRASAEEKIALQRVIHPEEQAQLALTNEERSLAGLEPVRYNGALAAVIAAHLDYLCESGEFSHASEDGGGPGNRLIEARVPFSVAGENLAQRYPTPDGVTRGWMNSPPHKENMLGSWYTETGIAYLRCEQESEKPRHLWGLLFKD